MFEVSEISVVHAAQTFALTLTNLFLTRRQPLFDLPPICQTWPSVCIPDPTLEQTRAVSEACHSPRPSAGDIRVTFHPHCGIVRGEGAGGLS